MNVDKEQILMLKSFKANKLKILMKLILPSNFYNLLSLFKINIGLSFVGVIVGEFIVSKEGIGYLIMYGSQVFKMQIVMMGVLILALSSFVLYEIVNIFIYLKYKRKDKN
jgi:NitT/TauT family transport system permease protein